MSQFIPQDEFFLMPAALLWVRLTLDRRIKFGHAALDAIQKGAASRPDLEEDVQSFCVVFASGREIALALMQDAP